MVDPWYEDNSLAPNGGAPAGGPEGSLSQIYDVLRTNMSSAAQHALEQVK
jgi:hypothetical protein